MARIGGKIYRERGITEVDMRILIPYDTSPLADRAVDEVLRRPWPAGTEVRLVTALEMPMEGAAPLGDGETTSDFEKVRRALREVYVRRIEAAVARFAARPDLKVHYELRGPGVKASLLEAIRAWSPDLVVAGSHGIGALGRVFLGSVALMLAVHAPCNVEIVKEPGAGRSST
jgi:nucleotide-binding universal stress UspA family protein